MVLYVLYLAFKVKMQLLFHGFSFEQRYCVKTVRVCVKLICSIQNYRVRLNIDDNLEIIFLISYFLISL